MPNVGRSAPSENHTQSVLFYKDAGWDKASASKWLKAHDYYADGLDDTGNLLRYRQYDPSDNYTYRTKVIEEKKGKPSIALVLALKKSGQEKDMALSVKALLDDIRSKLFPTQAISMPDIYVAIGSLLNTPNPGQEGEQIYKRLIDCYLDGGDIYAVVAIEGKLFKTPVTIASGKITLGDMTQVEIDYKPVSQAFKVIQTAEGKYRWFAFPAATAVLNRSGTLNSRQLYDNFVKHIEDKDAPYPYLTFYHIGEPLPLGQADWVARDGYTLLASGLFNDSPLAQCLAKSQDFDGVSIGFMRDPGALKTLVIDDVVKIPVDTDGILLEISAIREKDAACLMTVFTSKGVNQMNQKVLTELKTLAGDNPDALAEVDKLADKVDQINQTAEDENLVRQEQENSSGDNPPNTTPDASQSATEPATGSEPPVSTQGQEYLLTDEAMQAITEKVRSGFAKELETFAQLIPIVQSIQKWMDEAISQMQALTSRMDAVEKTDQAKVAQAVNDMPRNAITVGYRPTQAVVSAPAAPVNQEATAQEIAGETLAKIRAGRKLQ